MKRFSVVFAILATVLSCQPEEAPLNELDAMVSQRVLVNELTSIAQQTDLKISHITANTRVPGCNQVAFTKALDTFYQKNKKEANLSKEVVKGMVKGCYNGVVTYGTVSVMPDA